MALMGNTIKIRAEFEDFSGVHMDPETVELKIYDYAHRVIEGPIQIQESHKIDIGVYEYPYTVPYGKDELYYEFTGVIEGNPSVGRGKITRKWTEGGSC